MTTFLISHNLQVDSENVPPFDLIQLSKGLQRKANSVQNRFTWPSTLVDVNNLFFSPQELAEELVELGSNSELNWVIKPIMLFWLLEVGKTQRRLQDRLCKRAFGVDVVETIDQAAF